MDRSEVEERVGVKSVSHETTFEEDTTDRVALLGALDALCVDVQKETTDQKLLFKTVTVKIRYQGFETHTKSRTLTHMTNRIDDLKKTARELLLPYLRSDRKIRLIGVRVSSLQSCERQKTLF